MPLNRLAYRATTESNQPQARFRLLVTPTSPPCLRRYSPLASNSSVGKGPETTRVVYALRMPTTRSMRVGPMPEPVAAPPAVGLDDVTNGYVPWSTSSSVPCDPSSSTQSPASSARPSSSRVSTMRCFSCSAYAEYSSTTSSTSMALRL